MPSVTYELLSYDLEIYPPLKPEHTTSIRLKTRGALLLQVLVIDDSGRKVPIDRLPSEKKLQGRAIRTVRACDGCRYRKWKCDGKKPICTRCQSLGQTACIYSESKRIAERKQLDASLFRIGVYEELLRDIVHDVDAPIGNRITRALKVHRVVPYLQCIITRIL
jgi:hypothetical protein